MRAKTILVVLTTSVACLGAPLVDHVAKVETNNRNVTGDRGRALGVWQIHAEAWADVNRFRKGKQLKIYPYSAANEPGVARVYAAEYLAIIQERLTNILGRAPSSAETYCGYNLGIEGFKRRKLKLENCPTITKAGVQKLAALEAVRK
jgi:hypothetical protein